jgi:type IV secretory pathway protease TraF
MGHGDLFFNDGGRRRCVREASAEAHLERKREHADRPLRRAASGALRDTELVAVMPPEPIASFLADGGYLPRGVPLMKRVLALPGQSVCRHGLRITIDRVEVGDAQARDRRGRDLPDWQGCQTVATGDVFLMNPGVPDSLDGRYFGPLPASSIVGRAVPLWTDEGDDGRFVWRAATH